jgi:hypothetical protein
LHVPVRRGISDVPDTVALGGHDASAAVLLWAGDGESRGSEGYLTQDVQLAQRFRIGETQVRGRLRRPGNAVEIRCLVTPWLR